MSEHIKSIKIENYRGIKDLDIKNFKSVNILVGDNNAGKTSLLEAIQIFLNSTMYTLSKIAEQRENYKMEIRMNLCDSLYYLFNVKNNFFEIRGNIDNEEKILKVEVEKEKIYISKNRIPLTNIKNISSNQEEIFNYRYKIILNNDEKQFEINKYSDFSFKVTEPNINVYFIQSIEHIINDSFSELLKDKNTKDKAVRLLKEFEQDIQDIRYIPKDETYIPVLEISDGNYIPVALYGDGLKKALTMLNAIIKAENGVLLIDEYETALHTSVMQKVFKFVAETAKEQNVQLFLTTHSLEAVDKFLSADDDLIDDISIIRLNKKENKTYARIMSGKEAVKNREEYNMELRV